MFDPKGQKMDVFNTGVGVTPLEADAAIYGLTDVPDSGRIVAKPTPIHDIWADRKQPRRAIPSNIALHWHGDPDAVPELLGLWHLTAEKAADTTFDIAKLLRGEGEGLDSDKFPSVTQQYLALVRLASDILRHKLMNPITIIEFDGRLLIEAGERRWLAFHLLAANIGDEWLKIPATKADGKDSVFRQAGENMQRSELNAIGKARQLALLIMAVRESVKMSEGRAYKDYEEIVGSGMIDRRFYAQVADGLAHRIPTGMGEKIQGAMGLGKEQLSQYRALLRLTVDEQINDILWTRADVESWPELTIREIGRLTIVNLRDVLDRANWSLADLKALKEPPPAQPTTPAPSGNGEPPQLPILQQWIRKHVRNGSGRTGMVIRVEGELIKVVWDDNHQEQFIHYKDLHFVQPRTAAPSTPAPQMVNSGYRIGDLVRSPKGNGEVSSVSGRLIGVKTAGGPMTFDYTLLSKIVINESDIEDDVDPDAPPPQREWREGWTDGEGGINPRYAQQIADEEDSDKADSISQIEQPIITVEQRFVLQAYKVIAQRLGDDETLAILNRIIDMKPSDAKTLEAQGQLGDFTMDADIYLLEVMRRWFDDNVGRALQAINVAGRQ